MWFLKLSLLGLIFSADVAMADLRGEIEHLLDFVASTNCEYERNGNSYSGSKAREHIERKYKYFKDEIETAEEFILLSATKSTMSGKKYRIHCPDSEVIFANDWLLGELQLYRKGRK
jgi:hypothetical protein